MLVHQLGKHMAPLGVGWGCSVGIRTRRALYVQQCSLNLGEKTRPVGMFSLSGFFSRGRPGYLGVRVGFKGNVRCYGATSRGHWKKGEVQKSSTWRAPQNSPKYQHRFCVKKIDLRFEACCLVLLRLFLGKSCCCSFLSKPAIVSVDSGFSFHLGPDRGTGPDPV